MDDPILKTPKLEGELKELVEQADLIYQENFDGNVWFGRCIFLSWFCDVGTCKFCFRSTQKHKIKHPEKARRSVTSILAEAVMIKGFNWRLEFLTGGYGVYSYEEIAQITKSCEQILDEKIWLNIGTMDVKELELFKDTVGGVVGSIETIEPKLHDKVCPDKPLQKYFDFLELVKEKGFKRSMTIIIGLGEKEEDFEILKEYLDKAQLDRITVYALRPVCGTDFDKGPSPEEVAWWTAKIRTNFPKIEIIVGSAAYRIPEISLLLKAGANAFTKLPATNLFNTEKALAVENEVEKAGRNFISKFKSEDVKKEIDWDSIISKIDVSEEEKIKIKDTLNNYLDKFEKNAKKLF